MTTIYLLVVTEPLIGPSVQSFHVSSTVHSTEQEAMEYAAHWGIDDWYALEEDTDQAGNEEGDRMATIQRVECL